MGSPAVLYTQYTQYTGRTTSTTSMASKSKKSSSINSTLIDQFIAVTGNNAFLYNASNLLNRSSNVLELEFVHFIF